MISLIASPNDFGSNDGTNIFSPSKNPIIWQIKSDFANGTVSYFNTSLINGDGDTLNRFVLYPMPSYPQGTVLDLSYVLQNYVTYHIDNTTAELYKSVNTPFAYNLIITGHDKDGSLIDNTANYTVSLFDCYVYNANVNRIAFSYFNSFNYVVSPFNPPNVFPRFLTNKPNYSMVNDYSADRLYFLYDVNGNENINVLVQSYDVDGNQLTPYTTQVGFPGVSDPMIRLHISPKALAQSIDMDFTNVSYYDVVLINDEGTQRSEVRRYYYKPVDNLLMTNILWTNNIGGIDSYQFVNVQETFTIERKTYLTNKYGFSDGIYSDKDGDIFNPGEKTISVVGTGNYLAYTRQISDDESYWLKQLLQAEQAWVELSDGSLVPIMPTDKSKPTLRQRYDHSKIIINEFNFTLVEDVLPMDNRVTFYQYGDGTREAQFISDQMNGVTFSASHYAIVGYAEPGYYE